MIDAAGLLPDWCVSEAQFRRRPYCGGECSLPRVAGINLNTRSAQSEKGQIRARMCEIAVRMQEDASLRAERDILKMAAAPFARDRT